MTDTPHVQYRLPTLLDLTGNDMYAIKMSTGVDLMDPPVIAWGKAALLWWVSKDSEYPLKFKELKALTLVEMAEYIAAPDDDEDEDEDDDPADVIPDEHAGDDEGPKASAPSPAGSSS